MLVTIAIIMLAMGMVLGMGDAILPQTRLDSSSSLVGGAIDRMRSHAVFAHESILIVYGFDEKTVAAYLPYESDAEGRPVGPGRTLLYGPLSLEDGIAFHSVRLPDGSVRDQESEVGFTITPLGRVPPHDVVIYNPEYPTTEVLTVRVAGLTNRYEILEGIPEPEVLQDADLR